MKKLKPVVCVCLLSAMLMASQALSPGVSGLLSLYHVDESEVLLCITLPYLIAIPFTLLAGRLASKYPLKTLLIIGGSIISVTGLLPYFITDFPAVLLIRACMGIGLGLLFALTPNMAPEYYPEGPFRNVTIGMQSAWAGSGGFVFNIISGHLVQGKTQNIYLVYLLCAVFTVVVWILLPALPPGQGEEREHAAFRPDSLFTAFLTFLFLSAGMTISLSVSVFLAQGELGGPVEAGYAASAYSIAAFAFGCLYAAISKIVRDRAIVTACLVSAAGMLLCVLGGNLLSVYLGAAMAGAGLSLYMPSCINRIIRTTPERAVSMSIAVMMVGSSLGQTFSGIFVNSAAGLFGTQISFRFYVAAALFFLTALLSMIPSHTGD